MSNSSQVINHMRIFLQYNDDDDDNDHDDDHHHFQRLAVWYGIQSLVSVKYLSGSSQHSSTIQCLIFKQYDIFLFKLYRTVFMQNW